MSSLPWRRVRNLASNHPFQTEYMRTPRTGRRARPLLPLRRHAVSTTVSEPQASGHRRRASDVRPQVRDPWKLNVFALADELVVDVYRATYVSAISYLRPEA